MLGYKSYFPGQHHSLHMRFWPGQCDFSGLDYILHPEALAFNKHGLGMVQETVKDGRGEDGIVVKYLWPVLKGAVGGDNHGTPFVAMTDDLEEQVCSMLINGQVTKFVKSQ